MTHAFSTVVGEGPIPNFMSLVQRRTGKNYPSEICS